MAEGRDPDTGHFLPGNRLWEARSSAGPNPTFKAPEDLWDACLEYFEWNERNPLYEAKAFANGETANLPKMRAMTIVGLCSFIDITARQWRNWRDERPDLLPIIERVEQIIYRQKIEGAAADLLNSNIIARELGLADRQQVDATHKVEHVEMTFVKRAAE